jgi:hypothetical protein
MTMRLSWVILAVTLNAPLGVPHTRVPGHAARAANNNETSTSVVQDDDLDVLLDRLATYLESYETQLSMLIADEHFVQQEVRLSPSGTVGRGIGRVPLIRRQRTTDSEVMFLRLPGYAEWFGVRDTRKVDGKEVKGAGVTLGELLKNPGKDVLERAAAIVEASSHYNLGGRRTINMPTVPLEALSVRNHPRYIFKVARRARISGVRVRRLDFQEFDEPTLVQSGDGGSLWSRGSAWIEPASGALWRAELVVGPDRPGTYRRAELESSIRVEFMRNAAFDFLVPKELVESFYIREGRGSGRGSYSNYRRFSTSSRVVPGG